MDLVNNLTIAKNARVMFIKNLDIADGLVNGATALVLDIVFGSGQSMPNAVIVAFDNRRISLLSSQSSSLPLQQYRNGTPILPFEVKEHVGRSESSPEIGRIQIPLVLCWVCTIHKVQGTTLDKVIMSFKGLCIKGQAYIGFSRVTSLQE